MTFEEYKQALSKLDFIVERGDINNHYIYVSDDENQPLISFNAMDCVYLSNVDCRVLNTLPINEITYLFDKTKEFLKTSFKNKHLEPLYHLVWEWDSDEVADYLVGYDFGTGNWKIATKAALMRWKYQYEFTDEELQLISDGDKELLNKLNFLKEKI